MSDLMLDVGLANEIKMAARRAGATNDDLEWLATGTHLRDCLRVRHGTHCIVEVEPTSWVEKEGVVYFTLISNGMSGREWIAYLESKGHMTSDCEKFILRSDDFKATAAGTRHHIAVLKHGVWGEVTKKIRAKAKKMNFSQPNAEIACLIRDQFSNEELEAMGFYFIVCMHEPIRDSDNKPLLLTAHRRDNLWLHAYWDLPGFQWEFECGFAFSVSQPQ